MISPLQVTLEINAAPIASGTVADRDLLAVSAYQASDDICALEELGVK